MVAVNNIWAVVGFGEFDAQGHDAISVFSRVDGVSHVIQGEVFFAGKGSPCRRKPLMPSEWLVHPANPMRSSDFKKW